MLLPHERQSFCTGKESFTTRGDAQSALRHLLRQKRARMKGTLKVYRCAACHCFHIGNSFGRRT